MNVVERMAELAMIAHNGVNRDGPGNVPYIVHPHAVVCMLKSWGYMESEDPVTLAVAWGHDVLEDTDIPETRIRDVCGALADPILVGLHLLTFKPSVPSGHPEYGRLKAVYIEHVAQTAPVEILPVKIADRLCNTLEFLHDGDTEHARAYLGYGEPLFMRVDELKFADAIRREIADVSVVVRMNRRELRDGRLALRPWRLEDAAVLHAAAHVPEVVDRAGFPAHTDIEVRYAKRSLSGLSR